MRASAADAKPQRDVRDADWANAQLNATRAVAVEQQLRAAAAEEQLVTSKKRINLREAPASTCKSGSGTCAALAQLWHSSGTCVGLASAVLWRQACTEGTALAGEARGNLSVWLTYNTDTCFMLSCGKGVSLLVSAHPGMWWKPLSMLCPIAVGMQLASVTNVYPSGQVESGL